MNASLSVHGVMYVVMCGSCWQLDGYSVCGSSRTMSRVLSGFMVWSLCGCFFAVA